MKIKTRFCVAMSDDYPGTAHAACVADHQRAMAMFFKDHAGCQFKIVTAIEMNELLKAYRAAKWGMSDEELSDEGLRNYLGGASPRPAVPGAVSSSPVATAP